MGIVVCLGWLNATVIPNLKKICTFVVMKRKAIATKVEVKNLAFLEAIKSSASRYEKEHLDFLEYAKQKGLFAQLINTK